MSDFHVWECDRCGKQETGTNLPRYWGIIRVTDKNRPPGTEEYEKEFCTACMKLIQETMEWIPKPKPPTTDQVVSKNS